MQDSKKLPIFAVGLTKLQNLTRITTNYPLIAMRSKLHEKLYGSYMFEILMDLNFDYLKFWLFLFCLHDAELDKLTELDKLDSLRSRVIIGRRESNLSNSVVCREASFYRFHFGYRLSEVFLDD